ncbi:hypothetical protein [Tsuneonella suprasediminis]|uniref:hypothetical protein n=1 Tax=Tsuneonella suprasediminis TaxID=2306996 RepID=UPI002F934829
MKRIILVGTAVMIAVAGSEPLVAQSVSTRIKPGVEAKPVLRKPLTRPLPTGKCIGPDPAVTKLTVEGVRLSEGGADYRFYVYAQVRNLGQAAYRSSAGQQELVIVSQGGQRERLIAIDFPSLDPGQERGAVKEVTLSTSDEFTPTLSATIVYDPDIRNDGNAANDDCETGNNRKVITSQQLAQKLVEAH